ncbi:hypothetical protein ACS0TY_026519 [Phlomoides rotata]
MHGCIKSAAPALTIIALIYVLIRDWKLSHLKKKVCNLEKKNIRSQGKIKKQISALLQQHSQYRIDIVSLLDEGYSEIKSLNYVVIEKMRQLDLST